MGLHGVLQWYFYILFNKFCHFLNIQFSHYIFIYCMAPVKYTLICIDINILDSVLFV
jgi:hypothetical protein